MKVYVITRLAIMGNMGNENYTPEVYASLSDAQKAFRNKFNTLKNQCREGVIDSYQDSTHAEIYWYDDSADILDLFKTDLFEEGVFKVNPMAYKE